MAQPTESIKASEMMIEAKQHYTYANEEEQLMYSIVPLRSDFLCQASLFDERTYLLPKVLPGRAAVIVDSDEGWQDNFKRGMVTNYDFFDRASYDPD